MKAVNNIANVSLGSVLRNFLIIVVCIFLINKRLNAQTSVSSGLWSSSSVWGATSPSSTLNSGVVITIAVGHNVELSSALLVKSGATLNIYDELEYEN